MNETILDVLPINSLLGRKFFVPSYQRGYRWTTRQVTELLDDIWEFKVKSDDKPKKEFYCLQPLVVAKNADEWVLIDGQQRLTTIYLILVYLGDIMSMIGKEKYAIQYETRAGGADFLKNIDLNKREDNIDYFHICQAYTAISDWFNGKDGTTKFNFLTTLLNDEGTGKNVKVIWFEIGDTVNPIDIFTRINIGKISLTNAELIKALFLRQGNFGTTNRDKTRLKQLQIASEWDRIESKLQDDSFWYFIYEGNQNYATRIEYIFDLMKKKPLEAEENFTFHEFNADFEADKDINRIWLSIKEYFQTFEEWYNDRNLYHLIGYLINTGYSIAKLKAAAQDISKSKFKHFLMGEIKSGLNYDIDELKYRDKRVKPFLLLFNIQTILANENSNIRFPFDSYKNEEWNIEHIRSVKSDKPTGNKQKPWLATVLEYFTGKCTLEQQRNIIPTLEDTKQNLAQEIFEVLEKDTVTDNDFTPLYDKLLEHFKEGKEPETINSIANLALLDEHTNKSYKNAVFPIKRKIIVENDRTGTFIPICTKNVFLKLYSHTLDNVMFWQADDATDYLKAIKDTLSDYFPQQNKK